MTQPSSRTGAEPVSDKVFDATSASTLQAMAYLTHVHGDIYDMFVLGPNIMLPRRYGCPLLFFVGVDDENRSCILGQGLLRSECTETFEWFLRKYEAAAGGRKPKVTV